MDAVQCSDVTVESVARRTGGLRGEVKSSVEKPCMSSLRAIRRCYLPICTNLRRSGL